jgi:hypothetical protein
MHMTATLTKWYDEHGKHEIFAGNRKVQLQSIDHSLVLREELITNEVQHDLEKIGVAKTAREEKLRARAERLKQEEENQRMAKLYRKHVLKEPEGEGLVSLIAPAKPKPAPKKEEEVGSFGD